MGINRIILADIRNLRNQALLSGNTDLAARCERALAGDQDAWWLVRIAINDARRAH